MNEKLKWEAYKAELEKELEQRNKMKELETLLAEQSKYELNKQFLANNESDNDRIRRYNQKFQDFQ